MTSKRKLREEVMRLNYRIADLEERLCPYEEHDWKQIGYYFSFDTPYGNGIDLNTVYEYKCKRCGKLMKSELRV
jgi:hypothetical protein